MRRPFLFRRSMRIIGEKRTALDTARGRIVLVSALFALSYITVGARVVDLTFIQGELQHFRAGENVENDIAPAEDATVRADITDRNGVLLATSLKTASLYADPAMITQPEKTAQALAEILPDTTYGDVLQKLQRKARFVWIKRNLTPGEQYAVLSLGEPGLEFKSEWRRIYPQGPLAAHMVGFTDVDGHGLAGTERSFDGLLASGAALKMTIDIRLQHIVRRELAKAVKAFGGIGGTGTVLDLSNGQVLAAVSYPDFDPNDIGVADDAAKFNRLTLGVYELGSVFKVFSTAALLETLNAPLSTGFDTREPLVRGRFRINDYHPEKRVLTVPEVFMYSSNIGAALMGEMVGTQALKDFYNDLGLLSPMPLEIEEIGKPIAKQVWRDLDTMTAAFGHGIAVSPMQMVVAAGSLVGDGTLIKPTLVISDGEVQTQKRPDVRIVSPQTAHRMRQMMRLVVADKKGTGKSADVPGYRVGGKTGTAEKPDARGGYDRKKQISSFVGFFPMEAPRYAVFVMVDEPHGTKESFGFATAGWVAAPAVRKIVEGMAAVLAIPPVDVPEGQDMAAPLKQYVHEDMIGEKHLASIGTE